MALSVVGTERLLASGYFCAKLAQENLIKASSIPYTIVRATQFFEFVERLGENDKIVTRYVEDQDFQNAAFDGLADEIFDSVLAGRP